MRPHAFVVMGTLKNTYSESLLCIGNPLLHEGWKLRIVGGGGADEAISTGLSTRENLEGMYWIRK